MKKIRVWLDDRRPKPPDYDVHVKSAWDAIDLISKGNIECISLDHDLGEDDGTGCDVALYIERGAIEGVLPEFKVYFHTQNPVGKVNMQRAIRNAMRAWAPD